MEIGKKKITNTGPQSAWSKRIVCVVMALAMAVTLLTGFIYQKEVIEAQEFNMEVDSKGNIHWYTDSKGNPNDGLHFRTIAWNFSIIETDSSGNKKTTNKRVNLGNGSKGDLYEGKTKVGTFESTSDSSYGMKYSVTGLKKYYQKEGKTFVIKANAVIEFYHRKKGTSTVIRDGKGKCEYTDKKSASDRAKALGFSKSNYFDEGYFDQTVKFNNIHIIGAIHNTAQLSNVNVKSTDNEIDKDSPSSVDTWYKKKSSYTFTVKAKPGYVCQYVRVNNGKYRKTERKNVKSNDGGGSFTVSNVNKNTKVEFFSNPISMKVNYNITKNGKTTTVPQTFTFGETAILGNVKGVSNNSKITTFYTDKACTNKLSIKKGQNINTKNFMTLYGKFNANTDLEATSENGNEWWKRVQRVVNLYVKLPADNETYTIKYDGNGATGNISKMGSQTITQPIGSPVSKQLKKNEFTKIGYHLDAPYVWKAKTATNKYKDQQLVSSKSLQFDDSTKKTATLVAQWLPNQCKIVYDGNNPDSGYVADQTITFDEWDSKFSENGYVKKFIDENGTLREYEFKGWSRTPVEAGSKEAEHPEFTSGDTIDKAVWTTLFEDVDANGKEVRLYACWRKPQPEELINPKVNLTYKSGKVALNKELTALPDTRSRQVPKDLIYQQPNHDRGHG